MRDARPSMSDMTKIIVMNVVLAIAFVVLLFDAPLAYATSGAVGAGLLLWIRERRIQARRVR